MLSIWCMCAHSLSHVWLSVIMDCSPPSFFVHGIFQARILVWVAISYSRASSQPEDQTTYLMSPALADRFFTTVPPEKPNKSMAATYYCCYLSWESSTWSPSEKSYSFGTQMEYNLSDAFLDFPKDNLGALPLSSPVRELQNTTLYLPVCLYHSWDGQPPKSEEQLHPRLRNWYVVDTKHIDARWMMYVYTVVFNELLKGKEVLEFRIVLPTISNTLPWASKTLRKYLMHKCMNECFLMEMSFVILHNFMSLFWLCWVFIPVALSKGYPVVVVWGLILTVVSSLGERGLWGTRASVVVAPGL